MNADIGSVTPDERQVVLEVEDLRTWFFTDQGIARAVDGVSFSVHAGETVGIVGESGCGKSVTALSVMRLLEAPARIVSGTIRFRGRDVCAMRRADLRAMRGGDVAMVFQDPMTSLNPVLRIARQLSEAMTIHGVSGLEAARRGVALLGSMGIAAPERAMTSYPHQFSGGMRQRVVLAMGMSNEPALLLADEPTTALDVTIQAQILDLLRDLNRDFGTAIVLISHDLGVIATICARVIVMYAGEVVEQGPTVEVLANPRHPYTWALLNARPGLDTDRGDRRLITVEGMPPDPLSQPSGCRFAPRCPFRQPVCDEHPPLLDTGPDRLARCWLARESDRPLLHPPRASRQTAPEAVPAATAIMEVTGLVKYFRLRRGLLARPHVVRAVDGVDLTIERGEVMGVVGESGCGKSTFARTLLRLYKPDAGSIRFDGQEIAAASAAAIRPLRRRLQMVFQNPYASLNPRMTVDAILAEPLRYHGLTNSADDTRRRVDELLGLVGLGSSARGRYPHEFSGGQRQRISIARALAVQPDFIVADEPISALDVNIQAQIVNLMIDLRERLGLTYLFIAHDLAVVRHICDRIMVLHLGQVAEIAPADDLFTTPLHPYTRYLISAQPSLHGIGSGTNRQKLSGEPANAIDPPSGCRFHTRCPIARKICAESAPSPRMLRLRHEVACHFAGEF
ncbi:MAG TPA: ABC transporter ATP-binding protein [Acetobacteraceae bacterium]|jgi:peptide/nickel transport system ATP-binding protein|nr:ABC transporter ATP-binding protein [Acetobacteraceae bacterium]